MTYKLTNTSQPADPYYGAVSLLLHNDGADGSTEIFDSSPDPKTVTAVGNAQISTTQSKWNGSSLKFDGSGDYVEVNGTNTSLEMGGDSWTVEMWIYQIQRPSTTTSIYDSLGLNGAATNAIRIRIDSLGYLKFYRYSSPVLSSSAAIPLTTWTHVAVVKDGSTLNVYLSGTLVGSIGDTVTYTNGLNRPILGVDGYSPPTAAFNGYIDDLRVTKGVARYTSNFTPPTQPFFNNFKTGYDPHYFYDVSLLLKGDGTNGSTTIVDSSFDPKTVTAAGNAQISTAQSKFGESSIRFTVDSVDHLAIPASTSLQITVAEDFTVEAWIYLLGNRTYNYFVAKGGGSSREWSFAAGPTNLIFYWSTNGLGSGDQVVSRPADLPLNTWMHVAAVKVGSSIKLFKDGIQQGSDGTFTSIYGGNGTTWVGRFMDYGAISHSFNGHVDDLRITKGVARYTSNFTPPGPLPTY